LARIFCLKVRMKLAVYTHFWKPRSSARAHGSSSNGTEIPTAARTPAGAASPCSPSHFSSTLPPSETPTAPMDTSGSRAASIRATASRSSVSPEW
jgi:hypothetical protein